MSHRSMTLKNVMGGCELVDLKPTQHEKSLPIDLSLIGIDLHEIQKSLIPNSSHPNSAEVENFNAASIESVFSGENCEVDLKDNNNVFGGVLSVQSTAYDKVLKSVAQPDSTTEAPYNVELFDLNANKIVKAEPNEPSTVFTSIQNFYETFDVSDQIESMSEVENVATPSSTSTFDSCYEQELIIFEPPITDQLDPNFTVGPTVTSTAQPYEFDFISSVVNRQDSLNARRKNKKRREEDVINANEILEMNAKKELEGMSRKKPRVEKNISCSKCKKKFRIEAHLKVHFMVHLDDECVHSCPVCERRFCHRGALALHARTHGPRPHAFDIS